MQRLDLNLLTTLDALLRERSVTRAAERLGLSQPTVSASLARLRRHYDDALLYRLGNSYDLTPMAMALAARTGPALIEVEQIFAVQSTFEPAESDREFTIVCSDYGATVVGPALVADVAVHAPGVCIHLQQNDVKPSGTDEERLRAVDGVLMPHGYIRGMPHLDLYRDRWICVAWVDNKELGDQLTMQDLSRRPWAATLRGPSSMTALRQLALRGVQARVQVTVEAFLGIPHFVVNTDRLALMPFRLATQLSPHYGMRIMDFPFDLGPLVEALWWHPDFERDAEHVWLRSRLAAVVAAGLDIVQSE